MHVAKQSWRARRMWGKERTSCPRSGRMYEAAAEASTANLEHYVDPALHVFGSAMAVLAS